jgi:hypothetical protein
VLDGYSSSNLISTVLFPKSVLQFTGLILIEVFEINVTKEGGLISEVVKFSPSGSIEYGRLCINYCPNCKRTGGYIVEFTLLGG